MFEFDAGALGLIALHPLVPASDVDLLHRWVTQDRARFWGMTGLSRAEVLETYRYVDSLPTHHAFLARRRGVPVGLVQTYEPAEDPMGDYYEVRRGDIGFHLFALAGSLGRPLLVAARERGVPRLPVGHERQRHPAPSPARTRSTPGWPLR
ncbi:hypothetical protein C1701_21070 [Actinoalloteichus sp. AHMU CJ021]|uniref:GNAT family N-acetyltransferase n=1 Tax=Actinoalloteichus sp. AHMU CJ021 TaxID=2072503 RepID=UPI000CA06AD4|nr:hypothetical protein C1701_21070 [Actinoalloteichus sp. AHMU CJ021]